jgi:hypothetical protein
MRPGVTADHDNVFRFFGNAFFQVRFYLSIVSGKFVLLGCLPASENECWHLLILAVAQHVH